MKLRVVLGGPGTGKTSRLLSIVEEELAKGLSPRELAFVAFTKAAAEEAKQRAAAKFNLTPREDLPGFRTLHSMAYGLLGVERDEMMTKRDWKEFGEIVGEQITGGPSVWDEEDQSPTQTKGDWILHVVNKARTMDLPLKDLWLQEEMGIEWLEMRRFAETLRDYKAMRFKLDFNDLLSEVMARKIRFHQYKVAIVDEAQDLTRLQWQLVRYLFHRCERVYIGGDDDQAIYRWAGADVDSFLALKGTHEHLPVSYRLPEAVHTYALRILERIQHRFVKDYRPTKRHGSVNLWSDPAQIHPSTGTWLLLIRNGYLLPQWESWLRSHGYLYRTRWKESSILPDHLTAITAWQMWQKGKPVPGMAVKVMLPYLGVHVPRGFNIAPQYRAQDVSPIKPIKPWHEAFVGISAEARAYYQACLRNQEDLTKPPRIRIETIHGVKGGEADHVALLSDMSQRTFTTMTKDPDSEHRVYYVGVTRARESLHLLAPNTDTFYPFPSPKE